VIRADCAAIFWQVILHLGQATLCESVRHKRMKMAETHPVGFFEGSVHKRWEEMKLDF